MYPPGRTPNDAGQKSARGSVKQNVLEARFWKVPCCRPSEANIASSRVGRDRLAYGIVTDCTSIPLASL